MEKQSDLLDIRDTLKQIQHVLMDMNVLIAMRMQYEELSENEKAFLQSIISWMRFGGTEEK